MMDLHTYGAHAHHAAPGLQSAHHQYHGGMSASLHGNMHHHHHHHHHQLNGSVSPHHMAGHLQRHSPGHLQRAGSCKLDACHPPPSQPLSIVIGVNVFLSTIISAEGINHQLGDSNTSNRLFLTALQSLSLDTIPQLFQRVAK